MLSYVILAVQLVLLFLFVFWVSNDFEEKEIDRKYYWIWVIAAVVVLLVLGILGMAILALFYYLWSRNLV